MFKEKQYFTNTSFQKKKTAMVARCLGQVEGNYSIPPTMKIERGRWGGEFVAECSEGGEEGGQGFQWRGAFVNYSFKPKMFVLHLVCSFIFQTLL